MSRRGQEVEGEQEQEQAPGSQPRHDDHAFHPEKQGSVSITESWLDDAAGLNSCRDLPARPPSCVLDSLTPLPLNHGAQWKTSPTKAQLAAYLTRL
jgi:hypothetical protein